MTARQHSWTCANIFAHIHPISHDEYFETWGKSFIRYLDEIGALGPWLTLVYMVWVDEADFALLAERSVCIAHTLSSNLRLRSGIAPIAKVARAGIAIGIGLDGHALDDDQDYLRELRLAWTLANMRKALDYEDAVRGTSTPRDILRMATLGGFNASLGAMPLRSLPLWRAITSCS